MDSFEQRVRRKVFLIGQVNLREYIRKMKKKKMKNPYFNCRVFEPLWGHLSNNGTFCFKRNKAGV